MHDYYLIKLQEANLGDLAGHMYNAICTMYTSIAITVITQLIMHFTKHTEVEVIFFHKHKLYIQEFCCLLNRAVYICP